MWSLGDDATARRASQIAGSRVGKFVYTRLNFSPRVLLRALYGDKSKLTKAIHRHYVKPLPSPGERQGQWVLARELVGSSAWYERLWEKRDRIAQKPALMLWGMKDPTFGERQLARWRELFLRAEVVTFPDSGHFVQEEESARLGPIVREFLAGIP